MIVTYADSTRNTFHHQWLRHSCYSEVSGNPADGIRFTTAISFDSDIAPTSVAALDGDLAIVWNDGHTSLFGSDWLRHHAYDTAGRARRASWRPTTWRAELADHFPTVSWEDAVTAVKDNCASTERCSTTASCASAGSAPSQSRPRRWQTC